jgi:hypothetical protein
LCIGLSSSITSSTSSSSSAGTSLLDCTNEKDRAQINYGPLSCGYSYNRQSHLCLQFSPLSSGLCTKWNRKSSSGIKIQVASSIHEDTAQGPVGDPQWPVRQKK